MVPNKEIALKMLNLPISGIIVEGNEAGGHAGSQNLASLLKEIAPICPLPLIAAGGIYDHHTASLANILGANGVQVGTAFLLAKECQISPIYQELICKGEENGTSLISDKNGHLTRLLNISSEYPLNTTKYHHLQNHRQSFLISRGISTLSVKSNPVPNPCGNGF